MADPHDSTAPDRPQSSEASGEESSRSADPADVSRQRSGADGPQTGATLAPTGVNGPLPRATAAAVQRAQRPENPEEIQRIQVDEEDRLAFRVGVNLLTLTLIAVGIWLLIRLFRG